MASLYEMIFGNLSPPPGRPEHPASRGALLGMNYRNLPNMRAHIEDQRGADVEKLPDLPLEGTAAANAEILSHYPPGSQVYTQQQWDWLQKHMPEDPPLTPLADPAAAPDTSILARQKMAERAAWEQEMNSYYPLPQPMPPGPRPGPQFSPTGTTLNSVPWQ